jgi:hypothetical protein
MLEFMLRDTFHNTELPLVHNVTVTPKYFKEFAFIDVEMHYSLEGMSRTDQILATVMKTKQVLEKHISLKLYADIAQEIRSIFTRVARKIARGILKFGYTHAYSATQVLNNYEKPYVNMVLDNIDYSSLLVVIQGEFSHHANGKDIPEYQLKDVFNQNFMKKFDFGESSPYKKSLITVNRYIAPLNLHAHVQQINKADIKKFKSLEESIEILFVNKNPYKITEEFAQLSRARSGRYNPENLASLSRIEGTGNLYFRKNKMFSIPQDFISLKF